MHWNLFFIRAVRVAQPRFPSPATVFPARPREDCVFAAVYSTTAVDWGVARGVQVQLLEVVTRFMHRIFFRVTCVNHGSGTNCCVCNVYVGYPAPDPPNRLLLPVFYRYQYLLRGTLVNRTYG